MRDILSGFRPSSAEKPIKHLSHKPGGATPRKYTDSHTRQYARGGPSRSNGPFAGQSTQVPKDQACVCSTVDAVLKRIDGEALSSPHRMCTRCYGITQVSPR